jgi:iron complex outermembrane receptor protein
MAALASAPARAATDDTSAEVAPVTVIAVTPLPGTAVDVAKAPYAVHTLSGDDLSTVGPANATSALDRLVGGVNLSANLDDPFQPDLLYRGFTASPVLGTPQGLAVYQNGVRINEAFGDAVNWDLIPDGAIDRVDVVGTNPVYGLNALGGAVVVTMKNGFDDPGGAATFEGGAFGRRMGEVSYGAHDDHLGVFVDARALHDDGWRLFSPDRLRQLYAGVSLRQGRLTADLSYAGADNALAGEGAAPVQELAVSRRLIFTSPQLNTNRLNFVTLDVGYAASPVLSLQADAYVRGFRQGVVNGDATDAVACAEPALAGQLCQADAATPLTQPSGAPIPDLSNGGTRIIGQLDDERIRTLTWGGAAQASLTAPLGSHANQLTLGGAGDWARTDFVSTTELGPIDPALVVQPSGFFVSTPEGTAFTATPVLLRADDADAAAFATDTLDLTSRLSLTASGRFNWIRITLADQLGTSLNGVSTYARFNPAVGLAYQVEPGLSLYAGYAEGSRAPSPSEIECSDPAAPCLLPSSLAADPPSLKQVVSRSVEAGLRGSSALGRGRLTYSLGLYRTEVRDDIYGIATSLSAGFFQNIPGTLRQGGEADATYRDDRLTAYVSYAYVAAIFDTDILLPSPSNPFADADGNIRVRRGDTLPGIPRNRLKLGAEYVLAPHLTIGGDLQVMGSQFYRGDEANLLAPLPAYAVLGLQARYDPTRRLELFVRIVNVTNARYATFGVLGDPTGVGAPGVPDVGADPRFQSPATPIAAYAGVTARF